MPGFFYLCRKWWKSILALTIGAIALATIIILLLPPRYLAVATALPANPAAVDKNSIFEKNVINLFSAWGSPDDVDRIVGTGQLDTAYLAVADSFNLADHYRIKGEGPTAIMKAALELKKNSKVIKSEYGELKIKVWNGDRMLAPQLANALMDKLAAIHLHLQNETNAAISKSLQEGQQRLRDSIYFATNSPDSKSVDTELVAVLNARLRQYQVLQGEYELMIQNKPPAIRIVERARAPITSDRPKPVLVIIAAAILGFVFGILTVIVLEKRK